jgi:hypothetical protein
MLSLEAKNRLRSLGWSLKEDEMLPMAAVWFYHEEWYSITPVGRLKEVGIYTRRTPV